MNQKYTVTESYKKARQAVKEGNLDLARDLFDFGLMIVAKERYEGKEIDDLIEGVKISLWLERFWYGLENNNLLL
jgi:hypothetical protein